MNLPMESYIKLQNLFINQSISRRILYNNNNKNEMNIAFVLTTILGLFAIR